VTFSALLAVLNMKVSDQEEERLYSIWIISKKKNRIHELR